MGQTGLNIALQILMTTLHPSIISWGLFVFDCMHKECVRVS